MHDVVPVDLLTRLLNLRVWKMGDSNRSTFRSSEFSPSLHHSTLAAYRRYSIHIQSLSLFYIRFYCFSDFIRLVSSFTGIHTLTCSGIEFRQKEEIILSLYVERKGRLSRPVQVSTLTVSLQSLAGVNDRKC